MPAEAAAPAAAATAPTAADAPTSDVEDLVAFLHERNKPEVRAAALGIITGLTSAADGQSALQPVRARLLGALLRLVPCSSSSGGDAAADSEPAAASAAGLSRAALAALVNLSQDDGWAAALRAFGLVGRVMEFVRERGCPHTELLLMLLVNVTVAEDGCEALLQLGQGPLEGLHMAMLLKAFVTSAVTLTPGQPDPHAHIAALLTNTTRLAAGRQLLLQPGRGFLQALASQLQPGCSVARRRGCAGALRNVAISAEADGTLDELVADEAVLGRLLAPLGGGAAPAPAAAAADASLDARLGGLMLAEGAGAASEPAAGAAGAGSGSWRDPDDTVREALAEAIAVLASTDAGRRALWRVSAPERLRKAYEDEEHPGVCLAMEAAARAFMFPGDADGKQAAGEQAEQQHEQQEEAGARGPDTPQPKAAA